VGVRDLSALLAVVATEEGIVSVHLQAIAGAFRVCCWCPAAVGRLEQEEAADPAALVAYQEHVDRGCRGIARIAQDIVASAISSSSQLPTLAHDVTMAFGSVVSETRRVVACLPDDEVPR
jgi:hypothetical protein